MSARPLISVVSPVYRAGKIVPELARRLSEEVSKITTDHEILLVEDGSPDNSWEAIALECGKNPKVKGIKLSRNFGQHYAITAGLEQARGEYVVVMDCDLQDDPVYIAKLFEQAKAGHDIVFTRKAARKHNFFKDFTATMFNRVFNYLVDNKNYNSNNNVGAFSMLTRKAVDAFCAVTEYQRHYLMVLRWLGFSHTYVDIEHKARFEGKSSYTFKKLMTHALNGITSQSDKLLRLNVKVGIFLSLMSFLAILVIIILYFTNGFMSGWASLITVILFSTGVILTSIGISGIYIGKTFEQVKNRPKYLIDKFLNKDS